jgi:hypothetical protein
MRKIAMICLVLLMTPVMRASSTEPKSCGPGLYSKEATPLDSIYDGQLRILSPDGTKVLLIRTAKDIDDPEELHISYTVTIAGKTFTKTLPGFNGEVAWSPDSKAFAVTQTEGGGGLGSRVYVFYVDQNGMTQLDVSGPIEQDFGNPVECEVPVLPNTGFVSWKSDSSVLLVAAEVVPVSICKCSGTFRVYQMNLPALTIAKTYSQSEAKKQFWHLLGCELRNADDNCVRTLEDHNSQSRLPSRSDDDHVKLSTPVVKAWREVPVGSPVYALDDAAGAKDWLERALIQHIEFRTGKGYVGIEPGYSVFRIYPYLSKGSPQPSVYQGIYLKVKGALSVEDLRAAIKHRIPTITIDEYDVFGADGLNVQRYSRPHDRERN